ncbi:MAG: NlpC/P60 family protein [Coriobacteriia bacterium]|nr:NlpC/P60 family protein [Coriobacteriia bacterium]
MSDELEVAVEQYNAIAEALAKTRFEIARTQADLERATQELSERQAALQARVVAIYRGDDAGFLEVLFGASSFEDFVARVELLSRIGRHDAQLVEGAAAAKREVEELQESLENREAEQVALKQRAERQAQDIKAAIRRQEAYVAALNADIKKLIAEEEERQRRLAEERARRAAAAAAARQGRPATPVGDLPPGHPEALDIALRYLGVPYVWGGASPEGFDCSGLCVYVYAQIGIDLPRTSAAQFRAGAHIPPDRLDLLRPGDLVFFGTDGDPSRVHHVGIYAGDGNYVHAPQIGDVVKVSSLTERIARRGDYVGASRF